MKPVQLILDRIDNHKHSLAQGQLFKWLADETIDGRSRLSFAPSMLYYLMGFKDVLAALARREPTNPMDTAINAYCGEDAEHWRWFLTDLEKLGFDLLTWGNNLSDWCNSVWGPSTQINRECVFSLVNEARASTHPIQALALIWVFEATGIVFIGHTRKAAIAIQMDEELQYFGRLHYEEEFGHSVQAADFANELLPTELHDRIVAAVDELFAKYAKLFDCWYDHRNGFESVAPREVAAL